MKAYLQKKAEKWVSIFVLCGCVVITASLFFVAVEADALGDRLADTGFKIEKLK